MDFLKGADLLFGGNGGCGQAAAIQRYLTIASVRANLDLEDIYIVGRSRAIYLITQFGK